MTLKRTAWILFWAGLFIVYVQAGWVGIRAHTDPVEMDTVSYLKAALDIRQTGGIVGHIPNCFSGRYLQATQHPLYLLMLSPFAERNVRFFVRAKWATFFMGGILLAVFSWIMVRWFGRIRGTAASGLLVFCASFIHFSAMVACETLLSFFFILFWFFASKGIGRPRDGWLAGLAAGLAFLTKSLAILTLPIFVLSMWILSRKQRVSIWKKHAFWAFFIAFFLVSSPLLIRNAKVYGNPLYSDSTAVLWLDRWADFFSPDPAVSRPNLNSYLTRHGWGGVAKTLFEGLVSRDPKMMSDLVKPLPFWQNPIRPDLLRGFHAKTIAHQPLWALGLGLLAVYGAWRRRRSPETTLALVSAAFFFIFCGWYSKVFAETPPTRILYPVLFLFVPYAAAGGGDLVAWAARSFRARRLLAAGALAIFLGGYALGLVLHAGRSDPRTEKYYEINPVMALQARWALSHVSKGERVLVGMNFLNLTFYFDFLPEDRILIWPRTSSLEKLEKAIRDSGAQAGILDLLTVVTDWPVYQPYFSAGPTIGLRPTNDLPPFFDRESKEGDHPPLYETYRFRYA